jgi:pyruvate dehydrogenase E2 component (dihydrolipoamide acetyltransferase)
MVAGSWMQTQLPQPHHARRRTATSAVVRVADSVNVGFAVSSSQGLVVPVVKDAQDKTLAEIAREEKLLTNKARSNKMTLEDIEGETIALSNLGAYDIDSFLGIVPPPISTILTAGKVAVMAPARVSWRRES